MLLLVQTPAPSWLLGDLLEPNAWIAISRPCWHRCSLQGRTQLQAQWSVKEWEATESFKTTPRRFRPPTGVHASATVPRVGARRKVSRFGSEADIDAVTFERPPCPRKQTSGTIPVNVGFVPEADMALSLTRSNYSKHPFISRCQDRALRRANTAVADQKSQPPAAP